MIGTDRATHHAPRSSGEVKKKLENLILFLLFLVSKLLVTSSMARSP